MNVESSVASRRRDRSLQRFFVPADAISGADVLFPSQTAHQILRVFRLRVGQHVIILDDTGDECIVELMTETPRLIGRIRERRANNAEPELRLHLYQGLLKGRKLELVLQKCTEIGMATFTPVLCDRSVADGVGSDRSGRLRDIVREAAEQAGRGHLPMIEKEIPLADALLQKAGPKVILTAPSAGRHESAPSLALALDWSYADINLFVGPEGGFSPRELDLAEGAGATSASLGPRTLRAETAAIVGCALLLAQSEARAAP